MVRERRKRSVERSGEDMVRDRRKRSVERSGEEMVIETYLERRLEI